VGVSAHSIFFIVNLNYNVTHLLNLSITWTQKAPLVKGLKQFQFVLSALLLIIQIQKEHDCGGKDPLSICRHCFGMKVDIPGSNGNINS